MRDISKEVVKDACGVKPLSGDNFRSLCDHSFWHNARPYEDSGFRSGDIVFCKIDEVWRLFRSLRRSRKRIVLVTGEGDKPVTQTLWQQKPPHVIAWFGTNCFASGPGAHPLPLGIGNAGDKFTAPWEELQSAANTSTARSGLLYANFSTASNPAVRGPLSQWLTEPGQAWITCHNSASGLGMADYLRQMATHRFALCPPGNGEDTHRMWEALYCGTIPVVRSSPALRTFTSLPLVFVEDFLQLREDFLIQKFPQGVGNAEALSALWTPFWKAKFDENKHIASAAPQLPWSAWLVAWFMEIRRILSIKMSSAGTASEHHSKV